MCAKNRRSHPACAGWDPPSLDVFLAFVSWPSGRDPRRLFHDRETDAGLVAVLFRNRAPGVFGFLAGLERTLHLGRAFDELVEVHRAELAADHPEIAAFGHCQSPLGWR